jgi:FkbM family methyltransferase
VIWHWDQFQGSAEMLRYMRRDVGYLKAAVNRCRAHHVAVQAGGALGIFPKYLSQRFKAVYTFEPDPENFLSLCHNAPEANIVKFQAALGYHRELVHISHARQGRKPGNAHEGIRHVKGPGPIPTLRIDDLHLPVCDLIYLDVEGHELFALRGAAQTIMRCRPFIAVEINEMITYVGESEATLRAQLTGFEYREQTKIGSSDHLFVPQEVAC